jgi:hypothetical protein
MQADLTQSALVATDERATSAEEAISTFAPPDELTAVAQATGPAAAVILAVGLASLVLGVLSTLTAANASVSSFLTFSDRVGDLSGLTTVATAVFFGSWALLGFAWRRADPPLRTVVIVSTVLLGVALIGTFPPFFHAFEPAG